MMGKKKTAKMRGGGPVRRMSKGGGAINQHKRMAMGETVNMNSGGSAMYSRGYGVDEKSKRRPTELFTAKKGGAVKKKKKKQGYKDRKDESIAMRIKKKRTKK